MVRLESGYAPSLLPAKLCMTVILLAAWSCDVKASSSAAAIIVIVIVIVIAANFMAWSPLTLNEMVAVLEWTDCQTGRSTRRLAIGVTQDNRCGGRIFRRIVNSLSNSGGGADWKIERTGAQLAPTESRSFAA